MVSTISSHPPMIADELRRQADAFTDLMELKSKTAAIRPSAQLRANSASATMGRSADSRVLLRLAVITGKMKGAFPAICNLEGGRRGRLTKRTSAVGRSAVRPGLGCK